MKFIIFQKFTWNYLFFLVFLFLSIIRKRLTDPLFEYKDTKSEYFLIMYTAIFCNYLTIIPFLISKFLSRRRRNKTQENENQINLIENKIEFIHTEDTNTNKNLFKHTIIVSLFDFLGEASIFIFYFLNNKREVISLYPLRTYLIFSCVTQYIASYIILKMYFYKHHWLSMFINIFCIFASLTMDIIMITEKGIKDYQYYIFVLIRLIRIIFFSFGDSYAKKALTCEILSPYSLLLFKAIYETIFLGIFSIPFIFIKINDDIVINESIFVGFKQYLTGKKLLYSFLRLICDFLYQLFFMYIIDKFSPNHLALANIIDSFGDNVYKVIYKAIIKEPLSWTYYTIFFVHIILLIGAVIHNEIFIINRCGFQEKTKYFLDIKFNEEEKTQYLIPEEEEDDDNKQNNNVEEDGVLLEDKKIE